MTALFTLPFQVPIVAGAVLPYARLYFFQTTTTTPQNTYQEAALSTSHANPVEADSAGVFPAIYLDPSLPDYRVRLTTAADVQIYQQDGVPANLGTQQSMRFASTNPYIILYDTDGTANLRKYRIRAATNTFEVALLNDAESVATPIISYDSSTNILYSNTTEVAVTTSGSFTGTLSTGFAAAPTGTVYYRKVNNVVTLWINAGITGTSNGTGLQMTGLPAAIIPATAKTVPTAALQNNSDSQHCGEVTITAGGVLIFRLARTDLTANFVRNGASSFTNTNGKGIEAGWSITYGID